jgi:CheY-like chemotaxis protein
LLIVDIFMPGVEGLETIQRVHQQNPDLPIIVMSGLNFRSASATPPDFLTMATKLGAACALRKPFRPGELREAVDGCLNGSPDVTRKSIARRQS